MPRLRVQCNAKVQFAVAPRGAWPARIASDHISTKDRNHREAPRLPFDN
jgi:hypothetical protein